MRSTFNFVIKPKGNATNSTIDINGKKLTLNTEMQNHQYVNRSAIVVGTPIDIPTDVKEGDEVIVHHNVFRTFYDIRGDIKNSRSYLNGKEYLAQVDQVYLYKRKDKWKAVKGFCFVHPIKNTDIFSLEKEEPLKGIMVYPDRDLENNGIKEGSLVGFRPSSEYEFIIDGQRLYRVPTNSITIKYEYQGTEEKYNPSWLQSS